MRMTNLESRVAELLVEVSKLDENTKAGRVRLRKALVVFEKEAKTWRSDSLKTSEEDSAE